MRRRFLCHWLWPWLMAIPLLAAAGTPGFPGLIGLLELPSLYGTSSSDHPPGTALTIRTAPSQDSDPTSRISQPDALESHEWSYEQPAAAVYGYRHDGLTSWYQLRLMPSGRTGWVNATRDSVFHPLSALISESLPYLTAAWNGRLYRRAGDPTTVTQLEPGGPEAPVAVARSVMHENRLWFLVVALKEDPCNSAEAPGVLQAGWMPAHAESGDLNIWFYSRGC